MSPFTLSTQEESIQNFIFVVVLGKREKQIVGEENKRAVKNDRVRIRYKEEEKDVRKVFRLSMSLGRPSHLLPPPHSAVLRTCPFQCQQACSTRQSVAVHCKGTFLQWPLKAQYSVGMAITHCLHWCGWLKLWHQVMLLGQLKAAKDRMA